MIEMYIDYVHRLQQRPLIIQIIKIYIPNYQNVIHSGKSSESGVKLLQLGFKLPLFFLVGLLYRKRGLFRIVWNNHTFLELDQLLALLLHQASDARLFFLHINQTLYKWTMASHLSETVTIAQPRVLPPSIETETE